MSNSYLTKPGFIQLEAKKNIAEHIKLITQTTPKP